MKNIQNISLPPFQAVNYQLAIDEFWSVEDVKWMHEALNLAKQGAEHGEVPVGAILVHNQQIIGQGLMSRLDAMTQPRMQRLSR